MRTALNAVSILVWAGMWSLGGWWLVRQFFRLNRNEEMLVGLGAGLLLENLAANALAYWLPIPAAFWAASGLVFAAGLLAGLRRGWRSLYRLPILPGQIIALAALFVLFAAINRGLAIFDDYAHLPTTSLIAAGDFPPHFPLDPSIPYDYHYFLMLFAAQLMRVTSIASWKALDFARALTFAISLPLVWVWTKRITGSQLAGFLASLMSAFGTGVRWVLLLLPPEWLAKLSANLHMLGSGLQSGPDLSAALLSSWVMDGAGPMSFPFAFANGLQKPGILSMLSPNGGAGGILSLILLLTFSRWRNWGAMLLTAILWSSSSLMSETSQVLIIAAWGIIAVGYMIYRRTWRLPKSMLMWLGAVAISMAIGLVQGGAVHGLVSGLMGELVSGEAQASYQTVGFRFVWPPEIVSAHLGVMSLVNPWQLLAALAEMGPLMLVWPLLVVFGWKAFRAEKWYLAALIAGPLITFFLLFVEFTGSTGVRNTTRLYSFIGRPELFAVPLAWIWARKRSQAVKNTLLGLALATMLGGFVFFGVELMAIQRPVYSYYLTDLDVQANRDYWNRLEKDAVIFDSTPYRAPVVFGRPSNSSTTWYSTKPEWEKLHDDPTPAGMRAFGFSYAYISDKYWDQLSPASQKSMEDSCVKVMKEYVDWQQHWRRVLDLRSCK